MNATIKICSICEAELNGKKRWKDAGGNYFCPACWDARLNLAESSPLPTPRQESISTPLMEPPKTAVAGAKPAEIPAPESENVLLKKLGFLLMGILSAAYFDIWPLIQVNNGAQSVSISIKGVFLGWMMLSIGVVAFLPEKIGLTWRRVKGAPVHPREKRLFTSMVVFWVVMTGLTFLYIHSQGYEFKL